MILHGLTRKALVVRLRRRIGGCPVAGHTWSILHGLLSKTTRLRLRCRIGGGSGPGYAGRIFHFLFGEITASKSNSRRCQNEKSSKCNRLHFKLLALRARHSNRNWRLKWEPHRKPNGLLSSKITISPSASETLCCCYRLVRLLLSKPARPQIFATSSCDGRFDLRCIRDTNIIRTICAKLSYPRRAPPRGYLRR